MDKGGKGGPARWISILRPFQWYFSLLNSIFGSIKPITTQNRRKKLIIHIGKLFKNFSKNVEMWIRGGGPAMWIIITIL